MAASAPALVKPELLVWLRKRAGFTVPAVAAKLHVQPSQVEAWEAGTADLSVARLRLLADLYKRPLEVFFLDSPPQGFTPMRDHRRLPSDNRDPVDSPQLLAEIRRAQERRDAALEVMEGAGSALQVSPDVARDSEALAAHLRGLLGVPIEQQSGWRNSTAALREWISVVERLGILVFQTQGVKVKEMRGASISEFPLPVVLLNGADTPNGRVFTLMHELTHVVLRHGGICDYSENDREEVFCNRVAASILIPADELVRLARRTGSGSREWPDAEIQALASHFNISMESVLRRLVSVGLAPEWLYVERRAEYLREYERAAERRKALAKGKRIIIPEHRKAIKRNGRPYVRAVLGALHDRRVTMSAALGYLGVRAKHLPAIEREVWRPRSG